ncbi:thioredoxin reductase-like selenoprotein T homolog CG3887 [Teleopsis dalmanni]|uniref:thioredoxin reductase-like selenoprotein T homolog CG3887 n=1 Tax=Teleopsis dalmanni TaxID=139649 RepID=UPI0018CFCA38|nr:thioredoxin reductase-like selenoprotein T homolog CG3887 [Teleopsis dalmanni]
MAFLQFKHISICICITFCCVIFVNNNLGVVAEKEIPDTKFGLNVGGPVMTFSYCYSCGYRKAFEDYLNLLSEKYPQITVTGSHYDPPGVNMYITKIIFVLKIFFIVVIVSSYDIFGAMGQQPPAWWRHLLDNKMFACLMIFFVGNMLESQLVASGAFEITLNNVPIWSKLQTGRIPAPQELFQIIDNQLLFTDTPQDNPDFVK